MFQSSLIISVLKHIKNILYYKNGHLDLRHLTMYALSMLFVYKNK